MEALAVLFVIAVFIALIVPEGKSKPKSSGEKLEDGLVAIAKTIKDALGGGGSSKKPPADNPWDNPWLVIFLSIILGILFTYVF